MSAEQGLNAAAQQLMTTQPERPDQPEQGELDFLGMPSYRNDEGKNVRPQPIPLPDTVRGRGSRAGIRNRRTEEWIDYFAHRYRMPLEGLMAIGNLAVEEIRRSLSCTALEAMHIKIRALESAAPYLHSKLSSIEVKPAGTPGGAPSTLTIDSAEWQELAAETADGPPAPNGELHPRRDDGS